MNFTGPTVRTWKRLRDPSALKLPTKRPPTVLLLIHGAFSSTLGGFGALGVTDFGKAFMADALASFNAVLAFDHRTLGVNPLDNAEEIYTELRMIKTAQPRPAQP